MTLPTLLKSIGRDNIISCGIYGRPTYICLKVTDEKFDLVNDYIQNHDGCFLSDDSVHFYIKMPVQIKHIFNVYDLFSSCPLQVYDNLLLAYQHFKSSDYEKSFLSGCDGLPY